MRRGLACVLAVAIAGCAQSSAHPAASVTPSPLVTPSALPSPSPRELADWPQYHRNALRNGVAPALPSLSDPHRAWSAGVDGKVYASPLIVGGRVIVATENDTVYSFDLRSGAAVWRSHLATPVRASSLPCGDINPVTGITGTPAADALSGMLYVVAFVAGYHHVLFTLRLDSGAVVKQQGIDPGGSVPTVEQQRGALSLTPTYVYVPLGGLYGDCGPYHGYVVGVPLAGGPNAVYRTPSAAEAGIWSAMGATVAADGTVYAVTGNGSRSSSFDYSNTVLQLSPDLKVKGYFAPSNWASLDATDTDLGSVGVAMMPLPDELVSIGKEGVAYLLKASAPGGVGGQLAAKHVCSGAWGGSAWEGSTVYLPCRDGLVALAVGSGALAVAWRAPQVRMASPIIAAGAVWAIDVNSSTLYALDPASGAVLYQLGLGGSQHFSTLAATQGYLVAPAGSAVTVVATAPL